MKSTGSATFPNRSWQKRILRELAVRGGETGAPVLGGGRDVGRGGEGVVVLFEEILEEGALGPCGVVFYEVVDVGVEGKVFCG